MKKAAIVLVLAFGLFGVTVWSQTLRAVATSRFTVVFYETTAAGTKSYTIIQDTRTGGPCWLEVAEDTGSGGTVYAVPLTAAQCVP